MFENETNTIQGYIDYLNEILAGNFNEEELRDRLLECEEAIRNVKSSLPYDELDDEDEPIEDFSGDNLEDAELEDEVVQIEGLIAELSGLMQKAEDCYLDGCDDPGYEKSAKFADSDLTEGRFNDLLIEWIMGMISEKLSKTNQELDNQTIERMAIAIMISAKCRGNFDDSEKLAKEKYPEYRLDKDTIHKYHLFSSGIFHVTFDVIKEFEALHGNIDFKQSLNFHMSCWGNMI